MTDAAEKTIDFPLFTEAGSVEAVNARMGRDIDPRLRESMDILVRHLHAAVKEIRPTREEWLAVISFLTETGQMCTEWRQEFILLSDILGVSMLMETLAYSGAEGVTENTVLGPFHVADAPEYPAGTDIRLDGKGEPMLVRGHVLESGGAPVAGALLDVWQTNDDGFYDVQQPDVQPQWNFRGRFRSADDGSWSFVTARPRFYPIPDDGPVGKLLARLGRHPNRAAHIHFIVTAPGFEPLVTHIFDPDCRYLREDAVFGVKPSLVFETSDTGSASPRWLTEWDFKLAPAGKHRDEARSQDFEHVRGDN